jgi:hypothetical protein
MREIWEDIPNYEGYYQVSNLSRVKSLERWIDNGKWGGYLHKERILRTHKNQNGYYTVTFQVDNINKQFSVHRLVLITFVPNPLNKPCGNHKDGVKTNNFVDNLEWVTYKENSVHSTKTGLQGKPRNMRKVKITKNDVELYFDAAQYAADYIGCSIKSVSRVGLNYYGRHKVYGWSVDYL